MSAHKRVASSDLIRIRTSLKLDLLNAASVDDRLTAGNFRFFARVMQQVDMKSWTATIGDDRIRAELPGRMHHNTANDHRKAIRDAGYWSFDSGDGRHPTRYFPAESVPEDLTIQLAEKRRDHDLLKQAERLNRGVVQRPRKASLRGGETASDTVVHRPPVHLIESPYQQARRLQDETPSTYTRENMMCSCGGRAVRMIRARPTIERPKGTPWEFECQKCVDDDDRVPGIEHPWWEWRTIIKEPPQSETAEEVYRRARDAC